MVSHGYRAGRCQGAVQPGRNVLPGRGVPKDDAEAARWYRMAAEQGDAKAQFNLGEMYAMGEEGAEDYEQPYPWLGLAAAQGDKQAEASKQSVAP